VNLHLERKEVIGRGVRQGRSLLAAGLLLLSMSSQATTFAPLTGQQVLQQFNLVVLGNGSTASDVEGRIYVKGDFTSGNLVQRAMPASNYAAVTTGGNLTASTIDNNLGNAVGVVVGGNISGATVNNGGGAILGNATNSNFNGSGGTYIAGSVSGVNRNSGTVATLESSPRLADAVSAASSTNFAQVMGDLSTQLKSLGSNSTASRAGGKATFNAVADADGLAVFNLTSDLLGASEFEFNLNGAKTLIFNSNVSGAVTLNANFLGGSATGELARAAVWNFYDATSIQVGAQFGGSILATNASLTNYNNIEGAVVVKSFTGQGELHLQSFTGAIPGGGGVNEVPEPGSFALVALGLIGMLAARRRRRG
jgi:choice-of-anchor A domain-containing protein